MIAGPTADLPVGRWVNVGSGPADPERWTNLDGSRQALLSHAPAWFRATASRMVGREIGHWPRGVRYYNARRPLPFADGSVAVVYTSHLLEHLHRDDAIAVLREAFRVLTRDGVLRVVVPDLRAIVGWYLAHAAEPNSPRPSSDLLMDRLMLRPRSRPRRRFVCGDDIHEHKWMYDAEGLVALVREAGFSEPTVMGFLDSAIPVEPLSRVELASRVCNGAGVCVEARR